MVKYCQLELSGHKTQEAQEERLDRVFGALSHRARRRMLTRLEAGPASAGELASLYDVSLPAITKHLKVLETAGLISRSRDGRVHECSARVLALKEVDLWLQQHRRFWDQNLDRLAEWVEPELDSKKGRLE